MTPHRPRRRPSLRCGHRVARLLPLGGLALWLGSCATAKSPADDEPPLEEVVTAAQAVRISMAVRGVRPTVEELDRLARDPGALDALLDEWLVSSAFEATLQDMHAEQLKLASDLFEIPPAVGILAGESLDDIFVAVNYAPLVQISRTVVEGRPYSDIVTADTLWTNAMGAQVWGYTDYDPAGDSWQEVDLPDARPGWGILSDGGLWTRHRSNGINYQRGRANVIADSLLCADFLSRDVIIDSQIDLSDESEVAEALTDPDGGCVGCHQSLDPLGGFLWGWFPVPSNPIIEAAHADFDCTGVVRDPLTDGSIELERLCYPLDLYLPSWEDNWSRLELREPGFYGQQLSDGDLGNAIAADPRFASCTVKRFAGWMTRSDPESVPLDLQERLLTRFETSGWDARELVKALVTDRTFLAEADRPADEWSAGRLAVRPQQYARMVAELTGFTWTVDADSYGCLSDGQCIGAPDAMSTDGFGFRSMAGGMDGFRVTSGTDTMTPTKALVADTLAWQAAAWAVQEDLRGSDGPGLLTEASSTEESTVREQLVHLHSRVLGERVDADSAEIDASYTLFTAALAAEGEAPAAWVVVLGAMLQAPGALSY